MFWDRVLKGGDEEMGDNDCGRGGFFNRVG